MLIHIDKKNKIDDICSRLDGGHKRFEAFKDEDYFTVFNRDLKIGDTWDGKSNCSLKDSPQRNLNEKSRIDSLEEKILELEKKIKKLESKK